MNLDGSNKRRLIDGLNGRYNSGVSISKEGNKIAFSSNGDIFIADMDGENPVNLTNSLMFEGYPQFVH